MMTESVPTWRQHTVALPAPIACIGEIYFAFCRYGASLVTVAKRNHSMPTMLDDDTLAFAHKVFNHCRNGDSVELATLLDAGLPANLLTSTGDSLLMLASYHGRVETTRLLLKHGGDPTLANDRAQTPLAGAVFKGDHAVVELLLEHGAEVDQLPPGGKTALMFAAMFNRTDLLLRLLEAGADPELRDSEGKTALQLAQAMGAADTAAYLRSVAPRRSAQG